MAATASSDDLAAVDLTDLDLWQDGPPHALFARMRAVGGGGAHFCQGSFLAIWMLSIALTEIIKRMPDVAVFTVTSTS